MLALNDLQSRGWQRAVADGTDLTGGIAWRIMGVLVTAAANAASVTVYNAATAAGTDLIAVKAPIQTTRFVSFGPQGTRFTAATIVSTGTAETFVVFYIAE